MLTVYIRTFIMYIVVVLALRLMGKRQLSDFEPSELVVTIMISEIAAQPVQDSSQPLALSVLVIVLLLAFEVVLSYTAFKLPKARRVLYGTPSVFYEKGRLNIREMENQRFSVTDIMEAIRNEGILSLSEVDYVIMETNGNISVIQSSSSRPVTPQDMKIKTAPAELSYIIIDGGRVYHSNLKRLGFNGEWLKKQLDQRKIKSAGEVFYMSADKSGDVFIMKNNLKK